MSDHHHPNHPHDHDHGHPSHHGLNWALGLTLLFFVVELVTGLMANSLALLADAAHMASDVVALLLALAAGRIALRPAHPGMSYGYGRAKILAAQLNGMGLALLAFWIVYEAISRLDTPPSVNGQLLLPVAVVGLVVNLFILRLLHHDHNDVNVRAAYWHILGDALGSVAAIVAGVVIVTTGWMAIDPLLSFGVAAIQGYGSWRLIRETTLHLMEAAPDNMTSQQIIEALQQFPEVESSHHLHLWILPDGRYALSAHLILHDLNSWHDLLPRLQSRLSELGIEHTTLQPENPSHCG